MGAKWLGRGLCAATLLFAASASAKPHADGGSGDSDGTYFIQEHELYATESPVVDPSLMSGDLGLENAPDRDKQFIRAHRLEGLAWTHPLLGQDLYPQLAAGTLLTMTRDRIADRTGFQNRVDVDLYWLQIRLPTLSSEQGQLATPNLINFDLLLPWKVCHNMRVGMLVGADLGTKVGGLAGLRYQLAYGVTAGLVDVQARAGYGLESTSFATTGLPEAPLAVDPTARQAEVLYGAVVGLSWASWGKVALEANGAHLIDTRADILTLSPGIRLRPGHHHAAELGLAAVLDLNKDTGKSMDLRGIGGIVSLRYTFL